MLALEVADDELGSSLGGAQVGAGIADQLLLRARATSTECVGLHILVEQLGWIELGALARQKLKLDLIGVRRCPLANVL